MVAAVKEWVAALDASDPEYDRLRCEALWVLQAIMPSTQICSQTCWRPSRPRPAPRPRTSWPTSATTCPSVRHAQTPACADEHPRVRLEAIRGLSFFPTHGGSRRSARRTRIAAGLLARLHVGAHDRRAGAGVERRVRHRHAGGRTIGDGYEFIASYVARRRPGLAAQRHLRRRAQSGSRRR